MTSTEESTLRHGNKIQNGRNFGSKNTALLELHRMGEERVRTHYAMLDKLASEGDKECAMFLVNKVLPPAKGSRAMSVSLGPINTLLEIAAAQSQIFQNVSEGTLTIEEGEKLSGLIKDRQKTIEMLEFADVIQDINNRMKKAGI